jgi:50S ribosomal subunit-associated GTPase HflX
MSAFSRVVYNPLLRALWPALILLLAQFPLWILVERFATTLHEKRAQSLQIADLDRRNEEVSAALKGQEEYIDQLDVVTPPLVSLTQVVERVEQLADQQRLAVSLQDISQPTATSNQKELHLSQIRLSITVSGTADQVLNYLDQLEHIPELTVVDAWSLKPQGGQYVLSAEVLFFLRDASL